MGLCNHILFDSIVRIIVGEYEQRAAYKRYNEVGNGHDGALECPVRFILLTLQPPNYLI